MCALALRWSSRRRIRAATVEAEGAEAAGVSMGVRLFRAPLPAGRSTRGSDWGPAHVRALALRWSSRRESEPRPWRKRRERRAQGASL